MNFEYIDGKTALEKELLMNCPSDLWVVRTDNEEAPFAVIRKERAEGEGYIRYTAFNEAFLITGVIYNDLEFVKGADIPMIEAAVKMSKIVNKHVDKKNFDFYNHIKAHKKEQSKFQKAILYSDYGETFNEKGYLPITINKVLNAVVNVMQGHGETLTQGQNLLKRFLENYERDVVEQLNPEETITWIEVLNMQK